MTQEERPRALHRLPPRRPLSREHAPSLHTTPPYRSPQAVGRGQASHSPLEDVSMPRNARMRDSASVALMASLVLAFAAPTAVAQSSSTTCTRMGAYVNCRTTADGPDPNAMMLQNGLAMLRAG